MFNLFFFDSFFLILLFYKKIKIKWSLIITKLSKIKFKNQIKKYKILYNLSSILFEKTVKSCGVKQSAINKGLKIPSLSQQALQVFFNTSGNKSFPSVLKKK